MSRGDELRAAIRATPADLALRRVYADWLMQQGDDAALDRMARLHVGETMPDSPAPLFAEHWLPCEGASAGCYERKLRL